MSVVPLYLGEVLAADSFEAALLVLQVIKAVVGVGIAIIAYRGYRDNQSRPMLDIAAGFMLVLGIPFILYVGGIGIVALVGLPAAVQAVVIVLAEVSQIAGLLAILHALRM